MRKTKKTSHPDESLMSDLSKIREVLQGIVPHVGLEPLKERNSDLYETLKLNAYGNA